MCAWHLWNKTHYYYHLEIFDLKNLESYLKRWFCLSKSSSTINSKNLVSYPGLDLLWNQRGVRTKFLLELSVIKSGLTKPRGITKHWSYENITSMQASSVKVLTLPGARNILVCFLDWLKTHKSDTRFGTGFPFGFSSVGIFHYHWYPWPGNQVTLPVIW